MKGIATTLVIIVTAVVILVAALVVLTIFGGGMAPIVDITQAQSMCATEGSLSCSTTNRLPANWFSVTKRVLINNVEQMQSCSQLLGVCRCENRELKCETFLPI